MSLPVAGGLALLLGSVAHGQDLSSYAVLAGSEITNTGDTNIDGNIGLSPGTSFSGQASVTITNGTINIANAVAVQAKSDLTSAYNVLMGLPVTETLTGNLGERTLNAGVYRYGSSANLDGTLTLQGDADDIFVIQVGSELTTDPGASIMLIGGAVAENVFFVVGDSVALNTTVAFVGQILAGASITLATGATIECGAALAQTGAVTMDTNTINRCAFTTTPDVIADILGDDITSNGGSILDAINDYVANGGTLPLSFQLLALLSPTDLAAALEQMSGELGTGVAPVGMQGVDSFLNLLRGGGDRGGLAMVTGQDQPISGGTVSVMGYAPSPEPAGGGAFSGFDGPAAWPDPGQWTIWASAFGGQTRVGGDSLTGSRERVATDYGLAFGFERQVSTELSVGLALAGGGTAFELSDGLGSGESAMLQAAVFARSQFDQAYLAGTLATGIHQVSVDRYMTFAGPDHFAAEFMATSFAGEIEAGYDMGWLTPYAALRGQIYSTPAYSETTVSGASTFALDYAANTATSLRTEIGARADWAMAMGEDGTLTLHASAAWAHDMRTGDQMTASFQLLEGSEFTVDGATPAADSLLAGIGADLELGNGLTLFGSLDGRFSDNVVGYGGTVGLSHSW